MKSHPVWVGLLVVGMALAIGTQVSDTAPVYRWPNVEAFEHTEAFSIPAYFSNGDSTALIWRNPQADAPLVYTPLHNMSAQVSLLPYPDLKPLRWQAAPARDNTFHLIWSETNGYLYNAQLDPNGQTVRGPIEIATQANRGFAAVPLPGNRVAVFWIDDQKQLLATTIDQNGRPRIAYSLLHQNADRVAAAATYDGTLHLVWMTSDASNRRTVYYQFGSVDDVLFGSVKTSLTLFSDVLTGEQVVTSFSVGLDLSQVYVFWAISSAYQPDIETVSVLTFASGQPYNSSVSTLRLPLKTAYTDTLNAAGFPVGWLAQPVTDGDRPASVRWVSPAPGQQSMLPVALTIRTPQGWRPGVVYFQDGIIQGYQIIADKPADAAVPAIFAEPSGDLSLTWAGREDTAVRLFTANTAGQGLVKTHKSARNSIIAGVIGGLLVSPLGLAWCVIPAAILVTAPYNRWTILLVIATYCAAKLLWPPDLFNQVPQALSSLGFEGWSAQVIVIEVVFVIAELALAAYKVMGYVQRPTWQRWTVCALVDILLTWALFGANLPFISARLQ
ncbi:MAG: hypothetical protein JW966_08995 [Anaerolineae bacterium]|nr:hypothetical protein [Anaerolineae bacterium]